MYSSALLSLTVGGIKQRLVLSFKDGDAAWSFVFVSFSFSLHSTLFGTASCVFGYKPCDATKAFFCFWRRSQFRSQQLSSALGFAKWRGICWGLIQKAARFETIQMQRVDSRTLRGICLLTVDELHMRTPLTSSLLDHLFVETWQTSSAGEGRVNRDSKPHWHTRVAVPPFAEVRKTTETTFYVCPCSTHIALNVACTSC